MALLLSIAWMDTNMRAPRMVFACAAVLIAASASARADAPGDLARILRDYREADRKIVVPGPDKDGNYDVVGNTKYLAREKALTEETMKRLGTLDRAGLKDEDALTYDIFAWELADDDDEINSGTTQRSQLLALNQFNGSYLNFARRMEGEARHPFTRVRDYDDAIKRMIDFTHRIDAAIADMREGIKEGVVQPKVIVERMIGQIDAIDSGEGDANVFMGVLKAMPASISGPDRTRIESAYRGAVDGSLLPAYRKLGDFLRSEYLPKARETIGLSGLPGGKAMYLHMVRSETTEELTPEAIHALGLSELARIESEETDAMRATGFTGTLEQFRDYLRSDPRFKFRSADAMRADFTRVRDTVLANLRRAFLAPPKAKVEFRYYESYAAPDKPAAEYSGPSGDGKRPGTVYLNVFDLPSRPTYTTEALEMHEGIPGHHLQVALATENRALPNFRRYGGATAFIEGWALYAETLGPTLGLYSDPYQRFGELTYDAWRACRLVVDTGIHWMGWSHQQAVDFLLAHTTLSPAEAAEEVDRYIVLPGQALAYKIGEREFLALKAQAQKALGTKFDLAKFHEAVLKHGAMPLPLLDATVKDWIASQSAAG
jgi:uncharacterized protein (DUF885 family)